MNDKEQDSLVKEIDKLVDKYSGPTLWRETVELAVKRNPKIAQDVLLTIRDNKEIRANMLDSKFGVTQDKTMRQTMRIPQTVDDLLCIVDPGNFPMNQHEPKEALSIMVKLHKALPEFFIIERV